MLEMKAFIPEFMGVLTECGWKDLSVYNYETPLLIFNKKLEIQYCKPTSFAHYKFNGVLLEIETDSQVTYSKPSTQILSDSVLIKAKELLKGSCLDKYKTFTKIDKISEVSWKGKLINMTFRKHGYLPVKFDNDYCLIYI